MRTRKFAAREFIKEGRFPFLPHPNYADLPRKIKKKLKGLLRGLYYDRTRKKYCFYNPKMLSVPTPKGILDLFKDPIPLISPTVRMRRYEKSVE